MDLKKRLVTLPLLLAFAALPARAADPMPYSLRPGIDLPLIGLGMAMKYHSGDALRETRATTTLNLSALNRGDLMPFDRWAAGNYNPTLSSASGALAFLPSIAPYALNAWDIYRGNQSWGGAFTDFILLQEALAISSSMVSYSKAWLKWHPTPLTYGSSAPEGEKMAGTSVSSFFSGHTTAAFTAAVFTGYTYQLKHKGSPLVPWVWGGSLAAAGTVGAMRVMAGKHFPSDVLVGAAVGSLAGWLVPRLHLRKPAKARPDGDEGEVRHRKRLRDRLEVDLAFSNPGGSTIPVPTLQVSF